MYNKRKLSISFGQALSFKYNFRVFYVNFKLVLYILSYKLVNLLALSL